MTASCLCALTRSSESEEKSHITCTFTPQRDENPVVRRKQRQTRPAGT